MAFVAHQESIFEKYGLDVLSDTKTKLDKYDIGTIVAGEIEVIFNHLNGHEKTSLLNLGEIEKFESGAKILVKGKLADALYIIIDGETCEFRNDGATVRNQEKGVYGCTSLINKHPEQVDVIADGDVFAFKMRIDTLAKLMRFNAFFQNGLKSV